MSRKPKRWPYNADRARRMAIDAAEDGIDALLDASGAVARNDQPALLAGLKTANRKFNFIVNTLIRAKYGELPEQAEEDLAEEE